MLIVRILFSVTVALFFSHVISTSYAAEAACNDPKTSVICTKQNVESSYQAQFEGRFTDVNRLYESWDNVKILAGHGIIQMSTKFRPGDSATRAEALKMIMKSLYVSHPDWIKKTANNSLNFDDVGTSDCIYGYVADASASEIINPYSLTNRTFRPNDPMTRQEFIKVVYKAMFPKKLPSVDVTKKYFSDQSLIDESIIGMVISLRSKNIVNGYLEGDFKPTKDITRAEAAGILAKAFFAVEHKKRFSTGEEYKNPGADCASSPYSASDKQLDVIAIDQKDKQYLYQQSGHVYAAGCVPASMAMMIDYATRMSGQNNGIDFNKTMEELRKAYNATPGEFKIDKQTVIVYTPSFGFVPIIPTNVYPYIFNDPSTWAYSVPVWFKDGLVEQTKIIWSTKISTKSTYEDLLQLIKLHIDRGSPIAVGVRLVKYPLTFTNGEVDELGDHRMVIVGYHLDNAATNKSKIKSLVINDTWNNVSSEWNVEKIAKGSQLGYDGELTLLSTGATGAIVIADSNQFVVIDSIENTSSGTF